jgi:hypothetical protein
MKQTSGRQVSSFSQMRQRAFELVIKFEKYEKTLFEKKRFLIHKNTFFKESLPVEGAAQYI